MLAMLAAPGETDYRALPHVFCRLLRDKVFDPVRLHRWRGVMVAGVLDAMVGVCRGGGWVGVV